MSDRTDREKYLIILDRFYRGRGQSLLTKDESEALDYAISSIKTDLKYDLLYEETTHIADADKKIESTTKNDLAVDVPDNNVGKIEPTIKNDLGVDLISRADVLKLIYDYKDNHFENRKEYPINYGTLLDMIRWVRALPSVTPQEPFKPMVEIDLYSVIKQKYIEREVLDKIRAEIENINVWAMRYEPDAYLDQRPQIVQKVKEHVIEIIDKYKAGTEET